MESVNNGLHIVMFPWLAMGHLIPFFHLSKLLSLRGHRVTFVSTPRNLLKLPKIPPHLSPFLSLLPLPLPQIPDLPSHAESTTDVPYSHQQLLKRAFDLLYLPLTHFLEASHPDWVVYDYASHWLPPVASRLRISRAFLSLFNAAFLAFLGPPSALLGGGGSRSTPEDFTVVPEWVPFESDVVYRQHEVSKHADVSVSGVIVSETPDAVRFGVAVAESDVVVVRSSPEFEPEWFTLLLELYKRPVVSLGFLPPRIEEYEYDVVGSEEWVDWLDRQRAGSVVYVALGTESSPSQEELTELALGLEQSGLPFFWVLRDSPEWIRGASEMLPAGFETRVEGRGYVHVGWAPQVRILSHESVGGFLTHCGWNSVVEGVGFGRVLILFPMVNDQGLNARLLTGKKLGVETPRNSLDGSFTAESVSETVKSAMEDESLRARAREMSGVFGNVDRNDRYVDDFVLYLEQHRRSLLSSSTTD